MFRLRTSKSKIQIYINIVFKFIPWLILFLIKGKQAKLVCGLSAFPLPGIYPVGGSFGFFHDCSLVHPHWVRRSTMHFSTDGPIWCSQPGGRREEKLVSAHLEHISEQFSSGQLLVLIRYFLNNLCACQGQRWEASRTWVETFFIISVSLWKLVFIIVSSANHLPLETLGQESISLSSQWLESLVGRMTDIKHFSKQ